MLSNLRFVTSSPRSSSAVKMAVGLNLKVLDSVYQRIYRTFFLSSKGWRKNADHFVTESFLLQKHGMLFHRCCSSSSCRVGPP